LESLDLIAIFYLAMAHEVQNLVCTASWESITQWKQGFFAIPIILSLLQIKNKTYNKTNNQLWFAVVDPNWQLFGSKSTKYQNVDSSKSHSCHHGGDRLFKKEAITLFWGLRLARLRNI